MTITSGQYLTPAGIQRSISGNSERGFTTRTRVGSDFWILGERASAVGRVSKIEIAVALHVMAFGFHRRHRCMDVALVEPGGVDAAVFGNGERVHAVRARSFGVVYFHFTRKALTTISRRRKINVR